MKNKKIVIIFSVLLIILIIGGYFVIKYLKQKGESGEITEEYTPQEEISEEQLRHKLYLGGIRTAKMRDWSNLENKIVNLYMEEKE